MVDLTAGQYVRLSWRKVEIARRHVIEFEREYSQAMVIDAQRPTDSRAAAEGHADGAVFQCYAALDSFACGAARHFGLTDPGKASLNGIAARLGEPPPPFTTEDVRAVADEIRAVTTSDGWRDLSFYRNLAAHRGVVAQGSRYNQDEGFSFRIGELGGPDADRSEVRPILHRLVGWTEESVERLHDLGRDW